MSTAPLQPTTEDLVPIAQIAEVAGVSRDTVRDWIRLEAIPVFARGDRRKKFVRREDAEFLTAPRQIERRARA